MKIIELFENTYKIEIGSTVLIVHKNPSKIQALNFLKSLQEKYPGPNQPKVKALISIPENDLYIWDPYLQIHSIMADELGLGKNYLISGFRLDGDKIKFDSLLVNPKNMAIQSSIPSVHRMIS